MKEKLIKFIPVLLSFIVLLVLLYIKVTQPAFLYSLEMRLYDIRMRFVKRMESTVSHTKETVKPADKQKIHIIAIDSKSVDFVGRWPWSREKLSELIATLADHYQVRYMGLDIVFSEQQHLVSLDTLQDLNNLDQIETPDDILEKTLRKYRQQVIMGYFFTSYPDQREKEGDRKPKDISRSAAKNVQQTGEKEPPLQRVSWGEYNLYRFGKRARYSGFFDADLDEDGVIRKAFLVKRYRGEEYCKSLAFQMYSLLNKPNKLKIDEIGQLYFVTKTEEFLLSPDASMIINYKGKAESFEHICAYDVLNKTVSPEALKDSVVFIGVTDPGVYDLRTIPLETNFPGVELHPNILNNLIERNFMRKSEKAFLYDLAIFLTLFVCFFLICFYVKKVLFKAFLYIFLMLSLLTFNVYYFSHFIWLDLSFALLFFLYNLFSYELWDNLFVQREMHFVKKAMSQYVNNSVMDSILQDKGKLSLYGEERKLTLLFSDIRSFTSISEQIPPTQMVSMLTEYFTPLTKIILDEKGTLDKYMGDCIMAFWGAPVSDEEAEIHGVLSAIEMNNYLNHVINPSFQKKGMPPLRANYGLATGDVVVGNMGSKQVFDYTAIGDSVNFASRLEGINKQYGTQIMVCEKTHEKVLSLVASRKVDHVIVKGKTIPIGIYEIIDLRSRLSQEELARWEMFDTMTTHFFNEEIEKSREILTEYMERYPDDKLAAFYQKRINNIIEGKNEFLPYTKWSEK